MMLGDKNNVLHHFSTKDSRIRKTFLILFLFSIFFEFEAAEECDLVKCVLAVKSYLLELSAGTAVFSCKRLSDIPWCSEHCMHNYFPNAFMHQKKEKISFSRYCEENISSRLNSNLSCIAQHNYRLFACLANVNSLVTNNLKEEAILSESCSSCLCRKYLEFPNCSEQVLADCGKEAADIVKDLIAFILDRYQPVSCEGQRKKEVLSLFMHYQLGNDFVKAAESLDAHQLQVGNCISQNLQNELDLEAYLCGEYNPDINDCINYIMLRHNKSYPDFKRLLSKIISLANFKCKQFSFVPKILSTSYSVGIKESEHPSKDATVSNMLLTPALKNKNDDALHINNLNLTSLFPPPTNTRTEIEVKSEIPMKDSSDGKYVTEKDEIVIVKDSVNKNSKRHMNSNVDLNSCPKKNISISTLIFCLIFLLFVFR